MKKFKTRREWFKRLPLQVRLNAIEQVRRESCSDSSFQKRMRFEFDSFSDCLISSFKFIKTKQSNIYWLNILNKYNYEE